MEVEDSRGVLGVRDIGCVWAGGVPGMVNYLSKPGTGM
jgi:hypothetical protein